MHAIQVVCLVQFLNQVLLVYNVVKGYLLQLGLLNLLLNQQVAIKELVLLFVMKIVTYVKQIILQSNVLRVN